MAIVDNELWRDFFESFRNLPELWKIKSDDYKNRDKRNKGWKLLLEKYKEIDGNATIETVKTRINNIRTCYRRELKKIVKSQKSGASTDEVHTPVLWYFDILNFLSDQEIQIEGTSTIGDSEEEPVREYEISQQSGKRSKMSKVDQEKRDFLMEKRDFLQKAVEHMNQSENKREKDEADIYGESWACSYRKLSEEQKLYAKKAIEEVLVLGQLKKLSLNCVSASSSSSSLSSIHSGTSATASRSSTPFPNSPTFILPSQRQGQRFCFATGDPVLEIQSEERIVGQNISYPTIQDLLSDTQYSSN